MIQERRSALDSELVKQARLAEEYLDIAEVLIMALDINYNITMINQKGASILGYSKDEIIGKNFMENFLPQRIKEEITKVGQDIIKENQDFQMHYENPILTKNGEERIILWKNRQLKDENEKVIGLLTSGEDITELREQQQKLLHKSRLEHMGEMMSMVAHQWRQPLGAISAVSNNLLIKLELNDSKTLEEIKKLHELLPVELNKINDYVNNLSSVINDFRNFYKLDKELETIALSVLIDTALTIFNTSWPENNIHFTVESKDDSSIEIYYSEMLQVILAIFQNAQENALERSIDEPKIHISMENNSISILDNGGGVAEDLLYKIFEPYFSTKHSKNGTGLGLYMSKIIIEEHHKGILELENTEFGACFKIHFQNSTNI